MTILNEARNSYKINHDLLNQQDVTAPEFPILTAVYEAESVALRLEKELVERLRQRKDLLHPLVVTALTDSQRAMAYMLALAAGELEVVKKPGVTASTVQLTLPDKTIAIPITNRAGIAPIALGLLSFIIVQQNIDAATVDGMLARYEKDTNVRKQFQLWLKNSEWEDWYDQIDEKDKINRRIVYDLLKVARLYADFYKLQ
jgi:hypothetical protein